MRPSGSGAFGAGGAARSGRPGTTVRGEMELGIRGLGPGVRIGLGASAAVYRARQEQLGRDVAVKLLTERDPSFVRRFEREALALGQLSRLPGILTVHDTGLTEQGEPYLVLQYCPSSLLDRLHRQGPLHPAEAAHIIARVAVTVAGAHEAGIVHRDLKPANILLSHEGEPLVADLGMASVLGAGITTSIGFTPGYAAPENLRGEAGGPDVDVYALGASLFQLVTGRIPFTDPSGLNNLVALAVAIDSQPVEDLRPHGVPDELCRIIEAAMAKDPARRPTAAALAEQLEAVAERIADVGHALPTAPEVRPLVRRVPAYATAQTTLDPGAGPVGLLTPPRPGGPGPRFGPPGLPPPSDGPAPLPDLPAWARPRRAPPPDPYKVGLLPFKPWTRSPVDLFRRRPAAAGPADRARRRVAVTAAVSGAAVSGLVVAVLAAILPGINEGGGSQFATTTDAFVQTTTTSRNAFSGSTSTTWNPGLEDATPSMDAYQVQWTANRANAVAGLAAPGVLDTVRPATAGCASGWSDTAGIDGNAITLDLLVPNRADAGSEPVRLAQGITAYLNWVNANGGIGPNKLTVTPRLVDQRAGVTTSGAGQPFAVAALAPGHDTDLTDALDAACIPGPLSALRNPGTDLSTTVWTTPGPELGPTTEARLWAELIARRTDLAPATSVAAVGRTTTTATAGQGSTTTAAPTTTTAATTGAQIVGLVGPSGTGALYRLAFDRALADRPSLPVTYVSSADELATMPTPEVLIVMGSPEDCATVMAALPDAAQQTRIKVVAAPCVTPSRTATLPEAAGWFSLPGGLRDATTYSFADDAFQRLIDDELFAAGLDPADPVIRRGFGLYGWLWQQSLEIAAALPGGLTRSNLVATQRRLSGLTHPMLLDGVTLQTGPDDPWLIEGSDVSVWSGSADGIWAVDDVLDVNGTTPTA